jgi:hypothetical protein
MASRPDYLDAVNEMLLSQEAYAASLMPKELALLSEITSGISDEPESDLSSDEPSDEEEE